METSIHLPVQETVDNNSVDSLQAEITECISGKTLIVGIGNILRGDDGAGPVCIEAVTGKISAECINAGSAPENYLEKIVDQKPRTILFIDAANFYGIPGEIRLFSPEAVNSGICSTHTGSMELITAYLRNRIPDVHCTIIGIQSQVLRFNTPLSKKVEQAIDSLATILLRIFPHA